MFGRKSKRVTILVMLMMLALLTLGVGYTLWSKSLYIDGTVGTGSVDSIFVDPFTDDDNKVDDLDKDVGDTGTCINDPNTSCDPDGSGKNVPRKDKDVGQCFVEFDAKDPTGETLLVTILNAYPSYYCTVFFDVKNSGSIPVKIINLAAMGPHITASWTQLEIGQQIHPGDMVPGDLDIHVEQSAPEGGELLLVGKIQLAQWNEATTLAWQKCAGGAYPCTQAPEVNFAGNTVIMGLLGEGDFTQPESVHGGAALLPAGSSYDVTFQYHICTWDSYNLPGTGGFADTGWWDSFSVSTATAPYWNLGLSDPVSLPFVWGGDRYNDNILVCKDGTETLNMPGDPTADNYLNVVLDTGTDPESNGNHPSYGTITIEKIVVNP